MPACSTILKTAMSSHRPATKFSPWSSRWKSTVAGIDRRVAGKDLSLKGELRLTCTEVLANLYLAPHLSEFVRLHPDIDLSMVCTFQHLSLSRREADVAIRVTSNPPDGLIGRRLVKVAMGIYGGTEAVASLTDRA